MSTFQFDIIEKRGNILRKNVNLQVYKFLNNLKLSNFISNTTSVLSLSE